MSYETKVEKVGHNRIIRGPNEKAIERKIQEMGSEGWVLISRTDYVGLTRFDVHTRLTFQKVRR